MSSNLSRGRSPFLAFESFTREETEPAPLLTRSSATAQRSPFVSVYEAGDDAHLYEQPAREAYASLVNELHDEEFEQALEELESHVRSLHQSQLRNGASRGEADRLVTQYMGPLIRESEAAVSALSRSFAPREHAGIVEEELDSFLDEYAPSSPLAPELEQLFGSLIRKVGKAAKAAVKGAWQGIKQVGLAPILNRIKSLIRPMLDRVLQKALGHLPASVQPSARKLAEKLGFLTAPVKPAASTGSAPAESPADLAALTEPPAAVGSAVSDVAGSDAPSAQQEFNEQIAQAFLARDEAELELEMAESAGSLRAGKRPVFADLDDARERFISGLSNLKQGESAEPQLENFLPAILPALRLGIRLIGRPRVVNFLSPLLARLITNLVGPADARALSQAIVDSGLKLLNLELSETEPPVLASSAVVSTVEETVSRIASLPDHVLDNQELLEGFALEAFEHSAAANLPALFPEATYRQRPELLEAGVNVGWVMLPLRGPKRYKKCSRVFNVRLSPHLAEEVESFEGANLSDYLQDQLGITDSSELEADVHVYEVLPGTQLSDIEHAEAETFSDEAAPGQLHPLTPKAAAVLLGKPGLGRDLTLGSVGGSPAGGQRFYRLSLPHRGALSRGARVARGKLPRSMHVTLHLDAVKDEIRVSIFLSELKAQKLAVSLRQGKNRGLLAATFHRMLRARLSAILLGKAPRRLHIAHAGIRPGQTPGMLMQKVPKASTYLFSTRLEEWLVRGFSDLLKQEAPRVIAATEDAADGLTLRFRIEQPPGLKELCQTLLEKADGPSALASALVSQAAPRLQVEVQAGHRCG